MFINTDKLTESGCGREEKDKVCRSRGGESCAFDGAMIVLQPIADTAHVVHGPIACCGNSWEGRGTLSSKGDLYRMGFTTDMNEMDIVYGSEEKLFRAIRQTYDAVNPKAIFVYSTCVSGLIGEDIEAVCKKADEEIGVRVIPVSAPGFVGPKNLGNRIAGEVLLDHVIGTGEPSYTTEYDINLIGEYNIAGDLWLVEPLLKEAGIRVLSRITGDSTFEEITCAHRAKLNVVVCSRALINIAREMEKRYGIPYVEVSFFGKTEMSKALRSIGSGLNRMEMVENIIAVEEGRFEEKLRPYRHLRGKKAVLYTGGVKSWSIISALLDLGMIVVAVGTKKSTYEDEEKMKEILGEDAPLMEDVTPANLKRLMKEKNADVLVAGGRNLYLAVKEGFPFVDVNQERHKAYAGYDGLVNLAEDISNSIDFYEKDKRQNTGSSKLETRNLQPARDVAINPLKHSQSIGAAIALQGIDRALPIIHGAQGCSFLAKVLITRHFKEPIALASTKIFTEDVVMGSESKLVDVINGSLEKQLSELIGVLSTGLTGAKGDDIGGALKKINVNGSKKRVIQISTPDYEGSMETGYARTVEKVIESIGTGPNGSRARAEGQINVLAGSHLTPADFMELREIIESFGLKPIFLPDLSSLDGSRQGFSPLAAGGTTMEEIEAIGRSEYTIAVGGSMESPARVLRDRFDIEYSLLLSISGYRGVNTLMDILSALSGRPMLKKYERQRRVLIDGMRDAHFLFGGKTVCLALESDLSIQISGVLEEMNADVNLAVIPYQSDYAKRICAKKTVTGDLFSIDGRFDLLISNSHAEDTAGGLGIQLYQTGFPVYKIFGNTSKVTIGYGGTLTVINELANAMNSKH